MVAALPTAVSIKYNRLNYHFPVSHATEPPLKAAA